MERKEYVLIEAEVFSQLYQEMYIKKECSYSVVIKKLHMNIKALYPSLMHLYELV